MHSFVSALDTRPRGSKKGTHHVCDVCGRKHLVWFCFREVKGTETPQGMVRYAPTGKVLVAGSECARKVVIPVWEETRREQQLEIPEARVLVGSTRGTALLNEFRG